MAVRNTKERAKGIDKYSLKLVALQAAFWVVTFYVAILGVIVTFSVQWQNIPRVIYAQATGVSEQASKVETTVVNEPEIQIEPVSPALPVLEASRSAEFWNDLIQAIRNATDSTQIASVEAEVR
jgi:hypothetical protein